MFCVMVYFFFFSSRRRHTRFDCDWSSDVCSSDLANLLRGFLEAEGIPAQIEDVKFHMEPINFGTMGEIRSEERRVGKRVDVGGRRIIKKKKKNEYTTDT